MNLRSFDFYYTCSHIYVINYQTDVKTFTNDKSWNVWQVAGEYKVSIKCSIGGNLRHRFTEMGMGVNKLEKRDNGGVGTKKK